MKKDLRRWHKIWKRMLKYNFYKAFPDESGWHGKAGRTMQIIKYIELLDQLREQMVIKYTV